MNFRRIAASLSLDAGSYVRELELRVADLNQDRMLKGSAISGLHAQLDEKESEIAALESNLARLTSQSVGLASSLNSARTRLDVADHYLKTERAENVTFREGLRVADLALVRLESDLREAGELLTDITAKATQRITALETENDALREQLEMSPRAKQLDLVPAPDVPEAKPEVVYDGVVEKVYQIAHVCFIDGHKWYFRDGGSEAFYAPIHDEEFNLSVARREIAFASGDLIRVRLHQVSTRKGDSYKTVSEVTKVLGILPPPAPEQTTLLNEASAAF